jgi:hypothetical protein
LIGSIILGLSMAGEFTTKNTKKTRRTRRRREKVEDVGAGATKWSAIGREKLWIALSINGEGGGAKVMGNVRLCGSERLAKKHPSYACSLAVGLLDYPR